MKTLSAQSSPKYYQIMSDKFWVLIAVIIFVVLVIALIFLVAPCVADTIKVYKLDACVRNCEAMYNIPSEEHRQCIMECWEMYRKAMAYKRIMVYITKDSTTDAWIQQMGEEFWRQMARYSWQGIKKHLRCAWHSFRLWHHEMKWTRRVKRTKCH